MNLDPAVARVEWDAPAASSEEFFPGANRLPVTILTVPGAPGVLYGYDIADSRVCCDVVLPELAPYHGRRGIWRPSVSSVRPNLVANGKTIFDDWGWVGGRRAPVRCVHGEHGYRLRIENQDIHVATGGQTIVAEPWPAGSSAVWRSALLGPGLCLALAERGTFTLHASAVSRRGRAIVIVGDSGAGKSTFARLVASEPDWRRIADDLLQVRCGSDIAQALPRFPQPRLAPAQQYPALDPVALSLAAIYRVRLLEPKATPRITPLSPLERVKTLVRHTVAAKLFAPELIARHLDWCIDLQAAVPVAELAYPRDRGCPSSLLSLLAAATSSEPRFGAISNAQQ